MSFFIIPHSSSFVNPFSEVFSNFLFCGYCFRKAALILYHFQSRLSSFFSKFFQKTFQWLPVFLQTSFSILSLPDLFVNPFSEVFSKFSFRDLHRSVEQLVYYITFYMICQALFSKFFCFNHFFCDTLLFQSLRSGPSCWTNSLTDLPSFRFALSDSFYIITPISGFVN
jgi:hypothetical protein